MRRLFFSALLVIASLACIPHSAVAQSSEWKQIPIPSLHKFQPAQPKRIALPNGMVIFLQEDHELPFIEGTALIRGGSRDEVASKAGLVELYGDVWRTGGTKGKTGDALDDFLEARAARSRPMAIWI